MSHLRSKLNPYEWKCKIVGILVLGMLVLAMVQVVGATGEGHLVLEGLWGYV